MRGGVQQAVATDFEEEEPVRPEFHRNPATKQRLGYYTQSAGFMPLGATISPYFPRERQMSRLLRAGLVTLCFMVTVISGTMALLAFRVFMQKDALFQREFRRLDPDGNDYPVKAMGVECMKHYNSFKWTDFKHLTFHRFFLGSIWNYYSPCSFLIRFNSSNEHSIM